MATRNLLPMNTLQTLLRNALRIARGARGSADDRARARKGGGGGRGFDGGLVRRIDSGRGSFLTNGPVEDRVPFVHDRGRASMARLADQEGIKNFATLCGVTREELRQAEANAARYVVIGGAS